ncbi:MAG: glycoside hydrolase family 16 protein, partial [Bacteroidaceae bacterium]|nr:glycoside hydrolase family 16 protein [Bacteroidaceae bacterium]
MKKNILFSAALMFLGLASSAQTTITFDTEDYKSISVYDKWEESPFRKGVLTGNAGVTDNPDLSVDEVLGVAPNSTGKVVALQRSRFGSNTFGVRIDLKEPIRVTKQLQYIHVMTYLKDKPADSRLMVIGLGKRIEESWNWQTGEEEQFWATTNMNVAPKDGWQDVVVSFKGFSYSKEENANSGIDIYSLVIVPDVRSPHADNAEWVAYFDEIVVDNNPDKRFSTDKYALTNDKDAIRTRKDRSLNSVGLTSSGVSYTSAANTGKVYTDNTTLSVFSAKAGTQVQPTFNYSGSWMSAYVYVDWNNDGKFEYA